MQETLPQEQLTDDVEELYQQFTTILTSQIDVFFDDFFDEESPTNIDKVSRIAIKLQSMLINNKNDDRLITMYGILYNKYEEIIKYMLGQLPSITEEAIGNETDPEGNVAPINDYEEMLEGAIEQLSKLDKALVNEDIGCRREIVQLNKKQLGILELGKKELNEARIFIQSCSRQITLLQGKTLTLSTTALDEKYPDAIDIPTLPEQNSDLMGEEELTWILQEDQEVGIGATGDFSEEDINRAIEMSLQEPGAPTTPPKAKKNMVNTDSPIRTTSIKPSKKKRKKPEETKNIINPEKRPKNSIVHTPFNRNKSPHKEPVKQLLTFLNTQESRLKIQNQGNLTERCERISTRLITHLKHANTALGIAVDKNNIFLWQDALSHIYVLGSHIRRLLQTTPFPLGIDNSQLTHCLSQLKSQLKQQFTTAGKILNEAPPLTDSQSSKSLQVDDPIIFQLQQQYLRVATTYNRICSANDLNTGSELSKIRKDRKSLLKQIKETLSSHASKPDKEAHTVLLLLQKGTRSIASTLTTKHLKLIAKTPKPHLPSTQFESSGSSALNTVDLTGWPTTSSLNYGKKPALPESRRSLRSGTFPHFNFSSNPVSTPKTQKPLPIP